MSPRYEVIIYWSKEAFIAEVPELPGCVADGPSHAEALAAAEVMIREWIEAAMEQGWPIPEARGRLSYG
jgi:predicted RNase H-like HicB family nuclease